DLWREWPEIVIKNDPGFLHLGSLPEVWGGPCYGICAMHLPFFQKRPMGHVRGNQMSDWPKLFQFPPEPFVITRRRMQPDIASAEADHGHPYWDRQPQGTQRSTVDNPQ